MDRDELRKKLIEKLKAFPEKEKESKILCSKLLSSSLWQQAETILAFSPLSTEPDISPLLSDERVLLPYIENGEMFFSASRELKKSKLGFMEPEHIETDYGNALMLVPLLGFNGLYRLGRGGGFYDRYIRNNRDRLITAGIAYSASCCPLFIPEERDEKLDYIFSIEV